MPKLLNLDHAVNRALSAPLPSVWRPVLRSLTWFRNLALLLMVPGTAPLVAQDSVVVIRGLSFEGNHHIPSEVLASAIATTNSSWFARTPPFRWVGLGEKRDLNDLELRRDVYRITLFYRQSGYLDVEVDTVVTHKNDNVSIKFLITEGEPVRVTSLEISGVDSMTERKDILRDLPLVVGQPFNRFLMQASADSIVSRLNNRGYPSAEVFMGFTVHKEQHEATVSLDAEPGARGWFGPVTVEGAERVDSTFIRKILVLRAGQPYRVQDLFDSQRALYQTELFRLATVVIDSSGFQVGDSLVPIKVQVREGRRYRARASAGYGTYDCFRVGAGITDRYLFGSGRLLTLDGQLSQIGVGEPFDFNLSQSICPNLAADTIGSSEANYAVSLAVGEPRFLGTRLTGKYGIFAVKRSEFQAYLETEVGARVGVSKLGRTQTLYSAAYQISYGNTKASDATFCAFFNACTPAEAATLRENRRLAFVSLGIAWQRANNPIDPTRGHVTAAQLVVAAPWLGSSQLEQFVRVFGQSAWYRPLARDVVLSWRIQGGLILSPQDPFSATSTNYIPPEQRFYAGGPNTVRGYKLNELGPLVYVLYRDSLTVPVVDSLNQGLLRPQFSPTGGNTLVVANVELRLPSPILSRRLRIGLFVDAGMLYQRGDTTFANSNQAVFRVTPGFGIRAVTPLGPLRLDVGYNGYSEQPGALYLSKTDGTLVLVNPNFSEPRTNHWVVQFAIGPPF